MDHIEADLHPPPSGLADTDPDGTSRAVAERHGDPGDVQELRRSGERANDVRLQPEMYGERLDPLPHHRDLLDVLRTDDRHRTALERLPVDQPFLLEESQGLTKRGATDPELR